LQTITVTDKLVFVIAVIFVVILLYVSKNTYWPIIGNSHQVSYSSQGKVFVMYAASLTKIFENNLGPLFEKQTGYAYTGEGKGSIQIANMIIDGQRRPDVFISAGTVPIIKLMMANSSVTSHHYPLVQWFIKFAAAEMVIAYSHNSRYYDDLEKARVGQVPWYQVLSKQDFKFGRTDPELDPKGYYMIITAKLSNLYYHNEMIKYKILGDDRNSKQLFPEETLKATLESGQLDAVAAYKHEAISMGIPFITLPPQINLANTTYSNFYKMASYTLHTGQTIHGQPIYFCLTIPETVKNLSGATSFIKFLLSIDGKHILEGQGLNYIQIPASEETDKIPFSIREMIGKPIVIK
jgi:molybdate/tungstate transport system substrate-binding protein